MDWRNFSVWDWVLVVSMFLNVVLVMMIAVRAVFFKKFSLKYFGIEKIQRMGAAMPTERREAIWERGYLTRWQWYKLEKEFRTFSNNKK